MNRKAQTLMLAILSSIGVFIVGLMMINFVMPEVTLFRTSLNCASASTINDGTKLLCLVGDATVPYFVWAVFSLAIGAITARLNL